MEIKDIESIVRILKQSDVTDFELEQDGVKIKLTRGFSGQVLGTSQVVTHEVRPAVVGTVVTNGANMSNGIAHENSSASAGIEEIPTNWVKIESPIVGTFYRKPGPDTEPFVSVGDVVKKGETLCIVEAMKLMNEIEATTGGKVEKVCLNDGQVVEFGEVLFYINPAA